MAEKPLTWKKDAPDHWSAEAPHSKHVLAVWPRVDGSWVWEVFDRAKDFDVPFVEGKAESLSRAKQMAQAASLKHRQAEHIESLRTLPVGWDGDVAPAIAAIALEKAAAFLERIGPDVQRFYIYPTLKGGVQLEADFPSGEGMEFDFHADGRVTYWLFGREWDDVEERGVEIDSCGLRLPTRPGLWQSS